MSRIRVSLLYRLLVAGSCIGSVPARGQLAPPLHGLSHVTLAAADLSRSVAFYRRLGLEAAFHTGNTAGDAVEYVKIADRQYLELIPASPGTRPGYVRLAFDVDGAEVLHDLYGQQRGLKVSPLNKGPAGDLLFTVLGPVEPGAGQTNRPQTIAFVQYLPGSLEGHDAGEHLLQDRLPTELLAVGVPFADRDAARSFYLQKLSFELSAGRPWSVEIPGPSTEQVLLETAADRPRLYFEVATLEAAAGELRRRHLAYRQVPGALEVADPDGNLIELESAHIPVAVGSAAR